MWEAYSETDTRFPQLGTGGAPTGGPRYDFDPDLDSPTKFPEFYDGRWFIGEWNNGWIKTATLGDDGAATGVQCWVACNTASRAAATCARWTWSSAPTARST